MDFYDITGLFSSLLQFLGLLVFGIAAGWFTLNAFQQPERHWQLQAAVFLGFFFFVALLAAFTSPGGVGGFALGAGGALLFWGLKTDSPPKDSSDNKA